MKERKDVPLLQFIPSLMGAVLTASLLLGSSTTALSQSQISKSNMPAKAPKAKWDPSKISRSLSLGSRAAKKALSFRGVPYHFGGQSRNGIDCSALIQTAFKQWGILLPRTSVEQYKKGVAVPRANVKPGDLLFFKNTYKNGISHVGIFVGDNKFVHASSGRGQVTVSSLTDAYYLKHWAGARRVALGREPRYAKAETSSSPQPARILESSKPHKPTIMVMTVESIPSGANDSVTEAMKTDAGISVVVPVHDP